MAKNNNSKGSSTNEFTGGLNTDMHPLIVQQNQLIQALNVELVSTGDNQFVLKNMRGTLLGDGHGFSLTEGFIPLAVQVYNNIAYIISGKFSDKGVFEKGELGTYPSPEWGSTLENVPLVNVYSPIKNFLSPEYEDNISDEMYDEDIYHKYPFSTSEFNFEIEDFIDLTLQEEYDESVNFIFTDDRNPVRMINSRFKVNKDGTATIIDRRQKKDTNTYSSKYFVRTELILLTTITPTLEFKGVIQGGELKGGGYRYYFRYKNADGNLSDIIEESRLVSVHRGEGQSAVGVDGETSAYKSVKFKLSDLKVGGGTIEVIFTHISGEKHAIGRTYILQHNFNIQDDGTCVISHTGNEPVIEVTEQEINTAFSSVSRAKTVCQINNRLVLGNITSTVDDGMIELLEKISRKHRIRQKYTRVNSYSFPDNVYHKTGYRAGETYELAIVYILKSGGLTPAFPVRGLDNYTGTANYSGQIYGVPDVNIDSASGIVDDDNIREYPKINRFENVRGLYRTKEKRELRNESSRAAILLDVDVSNLFLDNAEANDVRSIISGYFIVRKPRNKDTLLSGVFGRVALLPMTNIDSVVGVFDFIGFLRNTVVARPAKDNYIGWDNGEEEDAKSFKSSDLKSNLYDLTVSYVPLFSAAISVVHPTGKTVISPEGRVPHTDAAVFLSGDMEVDPVGVASILNGTELLSTFSTTGIPLTTLVDDNHVQRMPSVINSSTMHGALTAFQFIPAGTITAAENEFTAKVNNTFNYIVNSGDSESPRFTTDGHWSKNASRNVGSNELLQYVRRNKDDWYYLSSKWDYTSERNAIKAVRSGDTLHIKGHVWVMEGVSHSSKSSIGQTRDIIKFKLTAAGDPTISRSWENVPYHIQYKTAESVTFRYAENTTGTEYKGIGYNADGTEMTTQLWPSDTTLGINKSATWKKETNDTYVYPYASVVHNYSNYVGAKFIDDKLPKQTKPEDILFPATIRSGKERTVNDLRSIYSSETVGNFSAVSARISIDKEVKNVSVADGDCFVTSLFKQMTYPIGIPTAPAATQADMYKYGTGATLEYGVNTDNKSWEQALSYEEMDEGRALIPNGNIVELVGETNNNCDVRSLEPAEPGEKIIYGTDRGFYPKVNHVKLYSEFRPNSTTYNKGLTGDYRATSYQAISTSAPIVSTTFTNRIMLSAANAKSEFFNGYRNISGLNFRDYNSELGQIIKLINNNNVLFCVFENGVAIVTIDGRTLINSKNDVYIDDAKALASKATLLTTKFGSINPESIISSYSTIYGVDYLRNKIWRIEGKDVSIMSDYNIETLLNGYKNTITQGKIGVPKIYSSFDAAKKSLYFSYSKLLNTKTGRKFFEATGSVYYNELVSKWTSEVSFHPKFQTANGIINTIFDIAVDASNSWESDVNSVYCNFHGKQFTAEVEFVVNKDSSVEKILTNLQILSNKIKPKSITYTITSDVNNAALRQNNVVYKNEDGSEFVPGEDYTKNTSNLIVEHTDIIKIREDAKDMNIGIFQENAYYKDGKYFIQVGKTDSFSRFNASTKRIRDKYFKIKIKYSGEEYVYLYYVLSMFTSNYD